MKDQNSINVANPIHLNATYKIGGSIFMLIYAIISTISYIIFIISFTWFNIIDYILGLFLIAGLWLLWITCRQKKQKAIGAKFINLNINLQFNFEMILNALGAIAIIIAVIYTAMNDSSGVINPLSIIFPILLFIVIISNVIFNILYIRSIKGCVLIARDSLANKTKKRKSNAIFASVMIIIKSFIEFGPTLALALGTAVVNDTVSSLNMNVNGSEFNYLIDQYVNASTGILISRLIQLFANIVLVIILISYHKELNKELKVENQNDLYNDFL